MAKSLHVKRFDTGETVHSVEVHNLTASHVERVMMGMLRNLSDEFYVDDSEFDESEEVEANDL